MPARTRPADPADHDTIRSILRGAYAQYVDDIPVQTLDRYFADLLDLDRHARHGTLLVAEVDGEIAGYASFYPDATAQGAGWPPGWAGGRGLAVHPDFRGHGIAGLLLAEIERLAADCGAVAFAFHTSAFMTTALALYRRLGYRRVPRFDLDVNAFYGVGTGRPWTALAYLRWLPAPAVSAA